MSDALPLWIAAGILLLVLQVNIILAIFRTARATETCARYLKSIVEHLGITDAPPKGGPEPPKFKSKEEYEKWRAARSGE